MILIELPIDPTYLIIRFWSSFSCFPSVPFSTPTKNTTFLQNQEETPEFQKFFEPLLNQQYALY